MPTSCTDCCLRLGIFKKKRRCNKCRDVYCDGCFSKVQKVSQWSPQEHGRLGQCIKCFVLFSSVIYREDVRLLDVKHLKRFLALNKITTDGCKEKYHLIDLIMQFASRSGRIAISEVEQERRRSEEVESLRLAAMQRREEETRARLSAVDPDEQGDVEVDSEASSDEASEATADPELPTRETTDKQTASHYKSVEDITNLNDIHGLSVFELKKILAVNFISIKGCCEKQELIDKVKQLWKEKEEMAATPPTGAATDKKDSEGNSYDKDICKVCMDNYIDCVLLDCGHLVACAKCGRQLAECPICRQLIVRVVHIFRA